MVSLIAALLTTRLAEDRGNALRWLLESLRSGDEVPPELAHLLADMLDPGGSGEWRLTFSKRRRGATPNPGAVALKREAGRFLREEIDEKGERKKAAMAEAQSRFGLKRTALEEALSQARAEELFTSELAEGE